MKLVDRDTSVRLFTAGPSIRVIISTVRMLDLALTLHGSLFAWLSVSEDLLKLPPRIFFPHSCLLAETIGYRNASDRPDLHERFPPRSEYPIPFLRPQFAPICPISAMFIEVRRAHSGPGLWPGPCRQAGQCAAYR